MRPKLNLKDESQMPTPNEYTDNFKSNLTCIFLSVRAKLKKKNALGPCVNLMDVLCIIGILELGSPLTPRPPKISEKK